MLRMECYGGYKSRNFFFFLKKPFLLSPYELNLHSHQEISFSTKCLHLWFSKNNSS